MAGYDHTSGMSNNAVDAYSRGVKPLSQMTLTDIRDAGWTGTLALAKALAAFGVWRRSEWHHSGGTWYNKVSFYDPADLVGCWDEMEADERDALALKAKEAKKTAKKAERRVKGQYAEWAGSRRHPKLICHTNFTGTLIDGWIHIDGGGKKKADGNHITWSDIDVK